MHYNQQLSISRVLKEQASTIAHVIYFPVLNPVHFNVGSG